MKRRYPYSRHISTQGSRKLLPLAGACRSGDAKLVLSLLDAGADVDELDSAGFAPLHFAVNSKHVGIVEILLRHGADADVQDSVGDTPLHIAATVKRCKKLKTIAELIIRAGADINRTNRLQIGPLDEACARGQIDVAALLLNSGACPDGGDAHHAAPMFRAICNRYDGIVKLLLDSGADASATTRSGETMLVSAKKYGSDQVVAVIRAHTRRVAMSILLGSISPGSPTALLSGFPLITEWIIRRVCGLPVGELP